MSFWEYFLNVNTVTDRIHLYPALCKHPLVVEEWKRGVIIIGSMILVVKSKPSK